MKKKIILVVLVLLIIVVLAGEDKKSSQSTTEPSEAVNTQESDSVGIPAERVKEFVNTQTQTEVEEQVVIKKEVGDWVEYKKNPVIKYKDTLSNTLWGDASVIKEDGIYKMWLVGGEPFAQPIVAKQYYATSPDGINWDINKDPVLEPTPGAWDSHGVETASVIKVGSTYHMYYTGYDTDFSTAIYSMGHATSKDGINWTKDPNNPIIKPQDDPLKWGYFTTAEPAIVYHKGTYYLYYASAKSNWPDEGSPFGIMVATSKDGSNFTEGKIAHTLSSSYDASTYRGYSTPAVYVDDGVFHLYHGVVRNPDKFEQVAISSAISTNGFDFKEVEADIFATGEKAWRNYEILAPSVLLDGDTLKMWFSGQATDSSSPDFTFGIGYATKQVK
jgi:predicted GH43/DUF377 family glycosyl hydrolase